MEMPKPTEHHLRFHDLAGQWSGTETMYPSQWDPAGCTATGRMTSRVDLSGFALIGDYHQERDGVVTFTGHSVMTYDSKEDCYVMHWFDCMGSPPEVFKGGYKDGVLIVAHGGPGMHARMTYDYSQKGRVTSRMEMSMDGRDWKTLFDGVYVRS